MGRRGQKGGRIERRKKEKGGKRDPNSGETGWRWGGGELGLKGGYRKKYTNREKRWKMRWCHEQPCRSKEDESVREKYKICGKKNFLKKAKNLHTTVK